MKRYNADTLELDHDETGEIYVHEGTEEPVTGIVYKNYSSGSKLYESLYLDGKIHGYYKEWYKDGQLKYFSTRYHDVLHGIWLVKTDTGSLKEKQYFSYGYCLRTEYYKDGVLQRVEKIEEDPEKFVSYKKRKAELEASGEAELWDEVLKYSEEA